MKWKKIVLQKNDSFRRIDRLAKRLFPKKTLSQIYCAMRKGFLKINGKKISQNFYTKTGDILEVAEFLFEEEQNKILEKNNFVSEKLKNVHSPHHLQNAAFCCAPLLSAITAFKCNDLVFFNKPRGLCVHGKNSLLQMVLQSKNFLDLDSISFRPGPLHRLDKDTTGLVVFSASLAGAKWFCENIKNHSIKKFYLGIALQKIEREQIWKSEIDGKTAVTIARPLKYCEIFGKSATFVEYEILTGKKHQIRIHSSENGHALLGDKKYGGKTKGAKTFFLHAYKMEFPENPFGIPKIIKAAVPQDFPKI